VAPVEMGGGGERATWPPPTCEEYYASERVAKKMA
jgi:hypothetical protein